MLISAKENLLRVIKRNHPQWVPNGMESVKWIKSPVVERPDRAGYDDFSVHWSYDPAAEGGTFPSHGKHTITDLNRWQEQVTIPDVDQLDWKKVERESKSIDRDQHLLQGFVEMGLFERTYLLMGMEGALMALLTESQMMEDLISAITDFKIQIIDRLCDVASLDFIWYGDDWGTQTNLFMPPDVWRQLFRPHTQRIYSCIKHNGCMVNQHSCGNIESIFSDIVEMGADIINPCQPCNDLAKLKRIFGDHITFQGGIDSQFVLNRPGVTADEVRKEVRKRIDEMAAGGGYIADPSHTVPYDPDILHAMNDEISTYGRKIYA